MSPRSIRSTREYKGIWEGAMSDWGSIISQQQQEIEKVLCAFGIDKQNAIPNEVEKDAFRKCVKTLCDVYFGNYHEKEQDKILGELMFNSRVFSKKTTDWIPFKTLHPLPVMYSTMYPYFPLYTQRPCHLTTQQELSMNTSSNTCLLLNPRNVKVSSTHAIT